MPGPASTLLTPSQGSRAESKCDRCGRIRPRCITRLRRSTWLRPVACEFPITITTAPSTRTALNYVGIYWTSIANAVGYLVYTDQNGGGTYVPLGYSFDCFGFNAGNVCGAIDKGVGDQHLDECGLSTWPITPPSADMNQALITTIVSGGGTLSLTLARRRQIRRPTLLRCRTMRRSSRRPSPDASTEEQPIRQGHSLYSPRALVCLHATVSIGTAGTRGEDHSAGQLEIFGLPIMGPLAGGGLTSGYLAIEGHGRRSISRMTGSFLQQHFRLSVARGIISRGQRRAGPEKYLREAATGGNHFRRRQRHHAGRILCEYGQRAVIAGGQQ